MKKLGGNATALLQVKDETGTNAIGEKELVWLDVTSLKGWLDFNNGENNTTYNAKLQLTTHIFMCDFKSFKNLSTGWVWNPFNLHNGIIKKDGESKKVDATSENARMVIDGNIYNILLIDNPMNLNQHLEFMLQYVGGALSV